MEKLVLSILVNDGAGILTRISGLFARRGYSILSISAGPTEKKGLSRLTVVAQGEAQIFEQIEKQVEKLEDVIEVNILNPEKSVLRELVMIKVKADHSKRQAISAVSDIFRAKIVDVSKESMTLEVTGDSLKIDGLIELLEEFEIMEIVRTGLSAIKRG